ncbi:DUF6879 family protein [Catenuloplanes indicus]|uniref:DUF6879 domain-containing protein n=1 Tax=Catenuloplanes indicus TaxID=137267 RepID=A0AAE4B382_9ACTN|nr:DUF6879 family protein [Catenuloplanes indicus]MDQ0371476.1 hypothetical protein [Catenuloplanes indicus]
MADGPVGLLRRSFDERLAAAGVAGSTALGVLLNLVDWAGPGEAIIVALLGSTLTFVVGAGLRAERRAETHDLVGAVPALRPELTRILALTAQISAQYRDRNAREELRRRCRRFVDELDGLSRGQLRTDAWDAGQLVSRTEQCRRRMQAVTNITAVGPGWWTATLGRDYWRANTAAIARGVQITRVFIVADRTEPAFAALLAEQRAAGVRTLVLDHADAPRDLLVNMVIWDDNHAWQAEMNPFGGISGNIFHHDPGTVRRLRDLADACIERAHP